MIRPRGGVIAHSGSISSTPSNSVAALGAQASAVAGTDDLAVPSSHSGISGWTAVGSYDENTLFAGEGVVTVTEPRHRPYELYRGIGSIPSNLKAQVGATSGTPIRSEAMSSTHIKVPARETRRCFS